MTYEEAGQSSAASAALRVELVRRARQPQSSVQVDGKAAAAAAAAAEAKIA
jgi:hypothetical protein